jgi:hypothetical protein
MTFDQANQIVFILNILLNISKYSKLLKYILKEHFPAADKFNLKYIKLLMVTVKWVTMNHPLSR